MSIGEIFYIVAVVIFSYLTFAIIRGNFLSKFDEDGHRYDLKDKEIKKDK